MHLDHKIPWNSVASQLAFAKRWNDQHHFPIFDLQARNQSLNQKAIGHFNRILLATIKEFSETELKKLDSFSPPSRDAKLFSDEVLSFPENHFRLDPYDVNSAANNPLSINHQRLEYWQTRAGWSQTKPEMSYSSSDGDLADAVKMLVIISAVAGQRADTKHIGLEALSALMYLASEAPISQLRRIHWGHGFGADLVADVALSVYMWANITEAVHSHCHNQPGTECQASLLQVDGFLSYLAGDALQDYDYPTQNVPHISFWNSIGVNYDWIRNRRTGVPRTENEVAANIFSGGSGEASSSVRDGLRQYLKDCFAILYVYDVFLRSTCGANEADDFWITTSDHILYKLWCNSC
ncbi:hypothetical protein ACHAPA_004151 [Fusarium lateritium]